MNLFKSKYFLTAQVASHNVDYTWGSGFQTRSKQNKKDKGHSSILIQTDENLRGFGLTLTRLF